MSDSTFDLSFESELDEFDPLEDTGADDAASDTEPAARSGWAKLRARFTRNRAG